MKFFEGQIFENNYTEEAAMWCNNGGKFHIDEIDPIGDTLRFQIVANKPLEMTPDIQIYILKKKLAETDYVSVKIAEGAATREEYSDVLKQREEWREQIRALELELQ